MKIIITFFMTIALASATTVRYPIGSPEDQLMKRKGRLRFELGKKIMQLESNLSVKNTERQFKQERLEILAENIIEYSSSFEILKPLSGFNNIALRDSFKRLMSMNIDLSKLVIYLKDLEDFVLSDDTITDRYHEELVKLKDELLGLNLRDNEIQFVQMIISKIEASLNDSQNGYTFLILSLEIGELLTKTDIEMNSLKRRIKVLDNEIDSIKSQLEELRKKLSEV